MKILILPTVVFKEINDATREFFGLLADLGDIVGVPRTITSANDGDHKGSAPPGQPSNSLHYKNRAWDFRSHDLTEREKMAVVDFSKKSLGSDWDFILENAGKENEHFHTEYDPK
jgi:hypothetical protein